MRIWDRFLTDADKRYIELYGPKHAPFGLGENAALLCIDNWATVVPADAVGAAHRHEGSLRSIRLTKELLRAARQQGMFVVHTTYTDPVATGRWGLADAGSIGDPPLTLHPDNFPVPGELVITKSHASGFQGTSLGAHLVTRGIDTLLVCGNSTSACVLATVAHASGDGYRIGAVEDCLFDHTEAQHAIGLFIMEQRYADVISYEQALAHIATAAPTATRDRRSKDAALR